MRRSGLGTLLGNSAWRRRRLLILGCRGVSAAPKTAIAEAVAGRLADAISLRTAVRSVGVLLIAVLVGGCAIPFISTSRPVLRPLTTQTGSDLLRDRAAQVAPEARPVRPTTETPARPPEPQQSVTPVDGSQPPRAGEPDPRAVIDWLLRERR